MPNLEEIIGTTLYVTIQTKFRKNRCRYNGVRLCNSLYNESDIFVAPRINGNWKKFIAAGTNYIILTVTLRIKKQMGLTFCLSVLCIFLMFGFFINAVQL